MRTQTHMHAHNAQIAAEDAQPAHSDYERIVAEAHHQARDIVQQGRQQPSD